jgi:hypothetical protein
MGLGCGQKEQREKQSKQETRARTEWNMEFVTPEHSRGFGKENKRKRQWRRMD